MCVGEGGGRGGGGEGEGGLRLGEWGVGVVVK